MIEKIISGGQTGADRGALEAARKLGIATGGYIVKGFLTEKGQDLSLKQFNLKQLNTTDFSVRTELNAKVSDGTVIFSRVDNKGRVIGEGTKFTLEVLIKNKKPFLINPSDTEFIDWVHKYNIKVLNVAGNRESQFWGIQNHTEKFLIKTIKRILGSECTYKLKSILNDNISGSSEILESIIEWLKFCYVFYKTNPGILYKRLEIIEKKLSHFAIVIQFIKEAKAKLKKKPELFLTFLKNYYNIQNAYYRELFLKIEREYNLRNKTVLLHSRSGVIIKFLKFLTSQGILLNIIQTESRPSFEGVEQARGLLGFRHRVTLIVDSATSLYMPAIDYVLLGADAVIKDEKVFVNKIGSYSIALLAKEFRKEALVIAGKYKFITSFEYKFTNPPRSSKEILTKSSKNLKVENFYFEKVPFSLITKIY
ncbi:MAG: YpsA SLOG family protein [Ignavibacteria bacterium]